MACIHFKETQKIELSWKWIFFIALYILMSWALVDQFTNEVDVPAIASIVFSLCLIVFFNIIIIIMKLKTEIDVAKISYRYKPFHIKPRQIFWEEADDFYIRDYKPLKEYGGHGLQRKVKYGRSFTVSGRKGLQIILKDGKKILIGTQKPKELGLIIEKLKSRTN
ncbi:hypothetical protein ACFLSE_05900 [Bacteroidota bacterium]